MKSCEVRFESFSLRVPGEQWKQKRVLSGLREGRVPATQEQLAPDTQ